MDPSLELSDIKKTYGDVEAVKGVTLAVEPGGSSACSAPTGPARRRPSA